MISREAASLIKYEKFGNARFLGNNPAIQNLSPMDRVYVSARRHACPRPDATVAYYGVEWLKSWQKDPENIGKPEPNSDEVEKHGIDITRRRYDECDMVTGDIIAKIRKAGPKKSNLLKGLTVSISRNEDEPAGYREKGSVPRSHEKRMSPRSTQVGFALARVLIEQFGWGDDNISWGDGKRTWERYEKGLDILDMAIAQAETPAELLAIVAELVTSPANDAKPEKVLGHIFDTGILEEENNYKERAEIKTALAEFAPFLAEQISIN